MRVFKRHKTKVQRLIDTDDARIITMMLTAYVLRATILLSLANHTTYTQTREIKQYGVDARVHPQL